MEDSNASSSCNGATEKSETLQEISHATYKFLLEQMESLRQENCSLKAGLKSNTSHITKLESEASKMKDMVLMLGTPALSSTSVESEYVPATQPFVSVKFHSDHTGGFMQEELPSYGVQDKDLPLVNHGVTIPHDFDSHRERIRKPDLFFRPGSSNHHPFQQDNLLAPRHATRSHELCMPSTSNSFPDVIQTLLASMRNERATTMKSLNLEEQKKELYMKELKELTSRLDSDKYSKLNDKIRIQLEHDIAFLKKTMQGSLGSNEAMQERLDARLKHIQFLDAEISNLEQHLGKSEMNSASLHGINQADLDDALCIKHRSFHQNGLLFTEVSTQTSKLDVPAYEFKMFDESHSLFEVITQVGSSPTGHSRVTRSIQTILTVKTSHGWSKPRFRHADGYELSSIRGTPAALIEMKQRESVDSFQSDFDDTASMHSFTTSLPRSNQSPHSSKKDTLFSPLLAQSDREELARRFIKMGETIEGCRSLKQLGCTSHIIQIMHDGSLLSSVSGSPLSPNQALPASQDFIKIIKNVRMNMSKVLLNIVNVTSETKSNREVQIFHALEVLRRYCEHLFEFLSNGSDSVGKDNVKKFRADHEDNPLDLSPGGETGKSYSLRDGLSVVFDPPIAKVTFIMKLSYDENIKRVINEYGGLYAIAELFILHYRCVALSHVAKLGRNAPKPDERTLQLLRRFVGFALINLTYGDIHNKTTLIQMPGLIDTIVSQMALDSEEMQQVMALFVRNLCWQADGKCRDILKKKNITSIFTKCALKAKREDTLKSLLSALWNLSGHCSENRHKICAVNGALAFLVSTLISRVPDIVESGGGILRNVSSVVATNEDYRSVLREQNCLEILLKHLKSGSLTIVSNACGTLWNLSARNSQDQKLLRDLGAISMLKNLTHSKHMVIAQGSNAALRNLLMRRPGSANKEHDRNESVKMKHPFEEANNSTEMEFSPRRHAKPNPQRIISPQNGVNLPGHSSQEKSAFSPASELDVRRFQNAHYASIMGSLPGSELTDSMQLQNPQSTKYMARKNGGDSYPDQYSSNPSSSSFLERNGMTNSHFSAVGGRVPNDGKVLNEKPMFSPSSVKSRHSDISGIKSSPGNLSLRDYLKMIGESKSSHCGTGMSPSKNSISSALIPVMQNQKESNISRAPDMKKLLGQSRNMKVGKLSSAIAAKCPEDLVQSLYDVEDDYGNDDGPVNYSLQFRDEHMTPGIRSPRTEEIYELAAESGTNQSGNHASNQPGSIPPSAGANGPSAKSEGGLSTLSVESNGSSATGRQDILKNGEIDGKLQAILPSFHTSSLNCHGDHRIDPSSILDVDDEKPTDFSALYAEEQLYEPIEHKSLGMVPYSPPDQEKFSHNENNSANHHIVAVSKETTKAKLSENTEIIESREEDDKFDTGAITPGHSYHYKSGRTSGIMTPRTPMEYETPMMFSRSSSLDSVSTVGSIHSSITSGPASRMMSGAVSPSHLPDSPSQSMPISPCRSPPPRILDSHPADVDQQQHARRMMDSRNLSLSKSMNIATTMRESEGDSKCLLEENSTGGANSRKPGYVPSLPYEDELNVYKSEETMSVMTKFSSLTIDSSDKIQPMGENGNVIPSQPTDITSPQPKDASEHYRLRKSADANTLNNDDDGLPKEQVPVIGYTPSLPTNDEILKFMHEGTLSPMTAFSEMSCLMDDNDGFQKTSGSVFSVPHSVTSERAEGAHSVASNKVSFASRSSATGASVPFEPSTSQNLCPENSATQEKEQCVSQTSEETLDNGKSTQLLQATKDSNDIRESDSDDIDSLTSCSDDDDLLQQCIDEAIPKKVSRSSSKSSKHSSKNSKSSRSKEKSSAKQSGSSGNESPSRKTEDRIKNNPSPVIPDKSVVKRVNIKQRIESANSKLNGITIAEYMDNLIHSDETDSQTQQNAFSLFSVKSKEVINNAETLSNSYSVKKKLKEDKKSEKVSEENEAVPESRSASSQRLSSNGVRNEHSQSVQSKLRIHSYLKEGVTSYATEGTPIEMSRCTSLSNITIESDSAEPNNVASQMKASNSVPDVSSMSAPSASAVQLTSVVATSQKPVNEMILSSVDVVESHDILESLEEQIKNMSIATDSNVINSNNPGYVTSMPEVDEIKKYNAEGSLCGVTEFSALTIDSITKIVPLISNERAGFPNSTQGNTGSNRGSTPTKVLPGKQQNTASEDIACLTDTNLEQAPRWPDVGTIHPSSHYNNENDNLGMKEERHNYMIEDTPLYLSGGSLSSLEFGSDDDNDLLKECISSALPPENKSPGQSYAGAPAVSTQNTFPSDSLRMYSHGAPDGKVDDSLLTNANYRNVHSASTSQGMTQQSRQNFAPPTTRNQFLMFQKEPPLSENLMRGHQQTGNVPLNQFSPTEYTTSYNAVTQPSGSFYHISRQASVPDSDLSISSSILGERQDLVIGQSVPGLMPTANRRHMKDIDAVQSKSNHDRIARPVKKPTSYKRDVDSRRRTRNQPVRAVDSSSGSSTSYRKDQRHRHLSNNSRSTDICNCQVSCPGPTSQSRRYNHGPVSASTSQLTDEMKHRSRSRRKSTNSTSKNSLRGYDHNSHHHLHHHPPKPTRTRNLAKNVYRPGIVQMYPPLKDMVGVLEGVATVAARGDKVVADRTQQYSVGNMSVKSSSSSLVRSATFINENPSEILLENMSQEERDQIATHGSVSSISQTHSKASTNRRGIISSPSPRGSSHSLKQSSQASTFGGSDHSSRARSTYSARQRDIAEPKDRKKKTDSKSKPRKVWSGIKKLLSPNDENAGKVKVDKRKASDKRQTKSSDSTPPKSEQAPSSTPGKKDISQSYLKKRNKKESSSSLSLTSSSDSNISSNADVPEKSEQSHVTPYGHLPKSPSVNALMRRQLAVSRQSQPALVVESSVWRRTPTSLSETPATHCVTSHLSSDVKLAIAKDSHHMPEQNITPGDRQEQPASNDDLSSRPSHESSQSLELQKSCPSAGPSFSSPSRTLSPRVVQQVAPFNYKPLQRQILGEESNSQTKSVCEDRVVNSDCKQTPV